MPEFMIQFLNSLLVRYDFEVINWFNADPDDPSFARDMGIAARFMNMFDRSIKMHDYSVA